MNIRAHHLLCMKYFKGKGYSEKFVSNFFKVINKLQISGAVNVVNHTDVICEACPHNANGKCIKNGPNFEEEVKEKDIAVINQLGVKLNKEINIEEIRGLIDLRLTKLREICKECEWLEFCA